MLAIQHRDNSFSEKWIEYCEKNGIHYKLVNCYSSDIVQQLEECHGLMWHWSHSDRKAALFAHQLTNSLEAKGKKVFPNARTSWHFDDKLGQKYLFECLKAPHVPTYVFYDKNSALAWARQAHFPKIFKLRGGAGSENVAMVHNQKNARRLINIAFGRGFKIKNRMNFLKERFWEFKRDRTITSFLNISKGVARLFIPTKIERLFPREQGYIYFQDFIPNNNHDYRVIVIGERAFAIKRMVRENDFRASGSGKIIYDPNQIPTECVETAFRISRQLRTQSLAFDFVFASDQPLIVETSYAWTREGYLPCPGYWTKDLSWVHGHFCPEFFMVEDFLKECFEH